MSEVINTAPNQEQINEEEYTNAMNVVGEHLYGALGQALQQLPENMRNGEVILQGISCFLANIAHQQAPNEAAASLDMLEKIYKVANAHLKAMASVS